MHLLVFFYARSCLFDYKLSVQHYVQSQSSIVEQQGVDYQLLINCAC